MDPDVSTTTSAALYRLMAWLSPGYPVGAFSYSHGLEWLVESGAVINATTLQDWVASVLTFGAGRNDAILFAHAHRAAARRDLAALGEIAALAGATAGSAERHLETMAQGTAFCAITRAAWSSATLDALGLEEIAYPVAVAIAAADHGIARAPALTAYLQALAANLVSAGVRLVPLGHTAGQVTLRALESAVSTAASEGMSASLHDLGGAMVLGDIAAMKHETQYTRLFRS